MSVSKRLRFAVLQRDAFRCRYCGTTAAESELHVDHVVPRALGGTDEPDNLVTSCHSCNSGKSSVLLGSEIIPDVSADNARNALEVSAAIQTAFDAEDDAYAWFEEEWAAWSTKDGEPVPLPDTWRSSVSCWLKRGMEPEHITRCIEIGMRRPNLPLGDVYRYVCGVCWRTISDAEAVVAARRCAS